MFVLLIHSPGHAQADFGEAMAVIRGVARNGPLRLPSVIPTVKPGSRMPYAGGDDRGVLRLPQRSGSPSSAASWDPSWTTEMAKLAVARILGDGNRQRTRAFTERQSHYLFEDRHSRLGNAATTRARSREWTASSDGTYWSPSREPRSSRPYNDALAEQCRRRQALLLTAPQGYHRRASRARSSSSLAIAA